MARESGGLNPTLSVVVPVFNGAQTLGACIEALLAQDFPPEAFEVLIIDDGSTDGTPRIIAGYADVNPRVRSYRQSNRGPAAARNLGARQARGAIVLFTDADCTPARDWLTEMYRPFGRSQEVIVGVKGAYRTRQTGAVARFAQAEFEDRYRKMAKSEYVDFVDTYAAAFRRDVFLALGGFDTTFPTANNEDVEFSYRMASHGHRMVFNPAAIVHHRHPDTVWKYLKQKFGRAYWRMAVYRAYPEKIKADSYTPQTLKLQTLLALVILASAFASVHWHAYRAVTLALVGLFLLTCAPFVAQYLKLPGVQRLRLGLERLSGYLAAVVSRGLPRALRRLAHSGIVRLAAQGLARLAAAPGRLLAVCRVPLALRLVRRGGYAVGRVLALVARGVKRFVRVLWKVVLLPLRLIGSLSVGAVRLLAKLPGLPAARHMAQGMRWVAATPPGRLVVSLFLLFARSVVMGIGALWGIGAQNKDRSRFTQIAVTVAADCLAILAAFLASQYGRFAVLNMLKPAHGMPPLEYSNYWTLGVLAGVTVLFMSGLYRRHEGFSAITEFVLLTKTAFAVYVFTILALYLTKSQYSRLSLSIFFLFCWLFVALFRSFGRVLYSRSVARRGETPKERILIVGTGEVARLICQRLENANSIQAEIVGFVAGSAGETVGPIDGHDVLGSLADLPELIEHYWVEDVFVSLPLLGQGEVMEIVHRNSRRSGVHFHVVSNIFDLVNAEVGIAEHHSIPITYLHNEQMELLNQMAKRGLDVVVSVALLLIALPFWAVVVAAIRLGGDGSAIFKQERVGKGGKVFTLYKFRTMRREAPKFALAPTSPDDQRVTPVGRLLRRTSLDELPQLLNVIKGDMSLVGPRPEMPFIVERYKAWERQRLAVKPGLTGLWQVLGRKDLPLHESLEYDFYYIKNQSLLLDLTILIKTIPVVLRGKGAY